jgi:hypothetical protein
MARPIPISNRKAKQWNEFLTQFNQQAAKELPQNNGVVDYSLLDANIPFGSYQGGQDYYKKKFADFVAAKGYSGAEDLKEEDFGTIQQLFRDIHTESANDPTYKKSYDARLGQILKNQGVDQATFDPGATKTGKDNSEGWLGTVSRNFYLPMESGQLSASKDKVLLVPSTFDEGDMLNGTPLYEPNKGSTGGVFSKFEGGGKLYEKGGKICYEDGGKVEGEIKTVKGGEFEKISEDVVEVEGKDHDQGGVKLNTGDEVEDEEMINTKEKIVLSATSIDPITKKTYSEAYEDKAKDLATWEKRFKKDGERWVGKRIERLKKEMREIYERQEQNKPKETANKKEGGGPLDEVDPPSASGAMKVKYYKVGEKEFTVRPGRLDDFLKEFPDAKEHDLVDGKLVIKTSQQPVGQKKNTDVSKETTQFTVPKVNVTKVQSLDEMLGNTVKPTLDIKEEETVNFFEDRNKKVTEESAKMDVDDYNNIIEPKIKSTRTNTLLDPFGFVKDPETNLDESTEAAARVKRNQDNKIVANTLIDELVKREPAIWNTAQSLYQDAPISDSNIQETEVFKNALDNLMNGYQGLKLTREDGSVLDTDKITDSQKQEIRSMVGATYQAKKTWDKEVDHIKESVKVAIQNPDYETENIVDFIKKEGVDKGMIPLSQDQWQGYFNKLEKVGTDLAPVMANLDKAISVDNIKYKQAAENEVAEFTNQIEPEAQKFKADLEAQVKNGLPAEEAMALWDQYKSDLTKQESAIWEKWNKKLNENSQLKLKSFNDQKTALMKKELAGTIFDTIGVDKIDSKYVEESVNSFYKLVESNTSFNLRTDQDLLREWKKEIYDANTYGEKFSIELQRGVLQTAQGIGGFMDFLGNYEAGNTVTDLSNQFQAENPQYQSGDFKFNLLIDPDYWISVVGPMVGQQLFFLPLSLTGAGLGMQLAGKLGMGAIGTQVLQGIGSAIATRPLNSMINAGSYFNDLVANGMSIDEAGEKTANVMTENMQLIGLDAFQMFFAFGNPIKLPGVANIATKVIGGAVTESGEEFLEGSIEYLQDNPFQTISDFARTPMATNQAVAGGMGGLVMGGVFSSPDVAAQMTSNNKKFVENVMLDMMSGPDMGKRYEELMQTLYVLGERGMLKQEQFDEAKRTLDFAYSKGKEIPANISPTQKMQILSHLSDVNQLEQAKARVESEGSDPTMMKVKVGMIDKEIKELEKKIEGTMAGKESMYFIGKVPYTKEQFIELTNNPEVFNQIVNQSTTFNVVNDDKVLNTVNEQIELALNPKKDEQAKETAKVQESGTSKEIGSSEEIDTGGESLPNIIRGGLESIEKEQQRQLTREEVEDAERQIVFDYAKENNLWIDDITSLGKLTGIGGNENTIVLDEENQVIYKINNLFNSKNSIDTLLKQVEYHNEIFPESAYEIVGYTGIDKMGKGAPYIEPILKQDFVTNSVQATPEEIEEYMTSIGFQKINETSFTDGEFTVSDLFPRNVLKGQGGNIHVIDDIVTKNEDIPEVVQETEVFTEPEQKEKVNNEANNAPPAEPPVEEVVADKEPPEQKISKFDKTIQNAKKVAEINKETVTYTPKTVKELSDTANKAWKEIEDITTSKEEAVSLAEQTIKSREWKGDESEQAALAGIVAKELFDLRQQDGNSLEQIEDYDKRAADLLDLVSKALTKSGQFSSRVGKFMAEVLMAYPEGITQHVQKTIDELNDGSIPVNDTTVNIMQVIFDILLKDEEGKRILRDYALREGLIKQKYKTKKEAVDAYLDAWLSTKMDGTLMAVPAPVAQLGDVVRLAIKSVAKTALTVAEKVELAMAKIKEKYKEQFDEARLRAQLEHILNDAEKFGDDWEKGKLPKNPNAVKTVQEKIEEEYQKRAKAVQRKLEKEKNLIDEDAEAKEINKVVSERLEAEKALREFEEGLKQLDGPKLKNLVAKVAKDFVNGKNGFTEEEIKRGIQQVNGAFGLSQRQAAAIDKSAKELLDINKKIKDNDNLSQQQIIKLNYQAKQASTQIMKMLTKRNWLDILHGMKIAGYFTAKTLESNVISNFVTKLFNKTKDFITSPVDILFEPNTIRKGNYVKRVKERLGEKFGKRGLETQAEELKTITTALGIAYDIMKKGTPHGDLGKVPAQYDLKPIEAWKSWSENVSKNPKTLSKVNEAGKILLEGTIGFYSTFVLRNLGAGDAAFRIPEQAVIQKKMADYLGVPLNMFLTDPQFSEWREDAEELSRHVVFQQDNILDWLGGVKIMSKNKYANQARRITSLLLTSSVMPFTKTPINLTSEVLRLIPGFAVPQLIYHTAQSYNKNLSDSQRYYNQKLAQKNLKYTALSIPLFLAVKGLIEAGIIKFPAPTERDKKKKGFVMNYAGSSGKMEINVPGMKKVTFDAQKFGPVGMYLTMVDATLKTKGSDNVFEIVYKMLESAPATLLENTFFTGINNVLNSIKNQQGETDWDKLKMDFFGPNTNILLPNIMADFTKLSDNDKYVRLLKDDKFMTEFYNRYVRNKIGFIPAKGVEIEGLKPKYNVWGQPIKTDVEGQPDWVHYLFDFTRSEDVNPVEQEHFFIYKNYLKTKDTDWIPPIATKDFKYEYVVKEKGKNTKKELRVKLSEELLNEYQRILGRSESDAVDRIWESQELWPNGQVEPSLKQVKKAYNKAQDKAKELFFTEYQSQLEKLSLKK